MRSVVPYSASGCLFRRRSSREGTIKRSCTAIPSKTRENIHSPFTRLGSASSKWSSQIMSHSPIRPPKKSYSSGIRPFLALLHNAVINSFISFLFLVLRKFLRSLFYFLLISSNLAFQLLYIFCSRQFFWFDTTVSQHGTHTLIVLNMLSSDGRFSAKVFVFYIVIGHFRGEIFSSNGKSGQKVCQRSIGFHAQPFFHIFRSVPPEKSRVTFGAYSSKTFIVHTAFIYILRQLFFCCSQFVPCFQARKQV